MRKSFPQNLQGYFSFRSLTLAQGFYCNFPPFPSSNPNFLKPIHLPQGSHILPKVNNPIKRRGIK